MRLDELYFEIRLEWRIERELSSSRRIVRIVPVFIPEKNNQTNYKCLDHLPVFAVNFYTSVSGCGCGFGFEEKDWPVLY